MAETTEAIHHDDLLDETTHLEDRRRHLQVPTMKKRTTKATRPIRKSSADACVNVDSDDEDNRVSPKLLLLHILFV
ncbi:MAG: hypothetical protein GY737_09660 [Desulfobacteraceae bacterium]|nr:hypothetical protein [Desulfobacteraceae bacterium]